MNAFAASVFVKKHPIRVAQSGRLRLHVRLVDLGCLSARLRNDVDINDLSTTHMSTVQSLGRARALQPSAEGIGSPVGAGLFSAVDDGPQHGWVLPSDRIRVCATLVVASCL